MAMLRFFQKYKVLKLKCPWCKKILNGENVKRLDVEAFIQCPNCLAEGPHISIEDAACQAAVKAWEKARVR